MSKSQRDKGKRGERELARVLRSMGVDSRRTAQHCGVDGEIGDVVAWPGVHIECKRVEALNVAVALDQSIRDCPDGSVPIVCHRRDRRPWLVTVRLSDLEALAQAVLADVP